MDWALDLTTGDLLIPLRRTKPGVESVAQQVYIAIRTIKGELFWNREFGVPYLENDVVPKSEALLGSKFERERYLAAIRDVILAISSVSEIISLSAEFEGATRTAHVHARVLATSGETVSVTVESAV